MAEPTAGREAGDQCPLRPGEACHLCVPGSRGPQECPTVWLVMRDPELRARLVEICRAAAGDPRAPGTRGH